MTSFRYHPEIIARFTNLRAGILLAKEVQNVPSPATLQENYQIEQRKTAERIGSQPLSEIESLASWRSAFRAFGANPTKYRSAPEALLRRLMKKGSIPSINSLVDICNMVSIRYALPVASFDTREISGAITVRFAGGNEIFTPLGSTVTEHPEIGEVIFADERNKVVARRWCWRQSSESAANPNTRSLIITFEAMHDTGQAEIEAAMQDFLQLAWQFVGGSYTTAILSPSRTEI